MEYKDLSIKESLKLKNQISFLIITATDIETINFHKKLVAISGNEKVIKTFNNNHTYYLGLFGKYNIVHVQCRMGSISPGASTITCSDAVNLWEPKAVIMIGIAFGINEQKQQIGDILISESIIPYNSKRIGKDSTTYRSIQTSCGQILLDRFKDSIKDWIYRFSDGSVSNVHLGHILSGEELVDNKEYRDELLSQFNNVTGGEMEGAGVASAAYSKKIEWILIKAICDFADGNKGVNKDKNQDLAASIAVDFTFHVLSSPNSFVDLGCNIAEYKDKERPSQDVANKVLFDFYKIEYEKYYLESEADKSLTGNLNYYSIWVSGMSGFGKTTIILRNLIISKKKFIYINLAACVGGGLNQIFHQIYLQIHDIINPGKESKEFESIIKTTKEIVSILKKNYGQTEILLFIEEIPISDSLIFKDFISQIFALIITLNVSTTKFVFSSLESPKEHINNNQEKIYEKIKFITHSAWPEQKLKQLIEIICTELDLSFSEDDKTQIISFSKGSPRFIKRFFRDFLASSTNDTCDIHKLVQLTENELQR